MSLKFTGKSLDECLSKASKEINITKENIRYKIVKEKHSLISNKVIIEINEIQLDSSNSKDSLKNTKDIKRENVHDKLNIQVDCNDEKPIGAGVENGKIIVTENYSEEGSEPITIKPCEKISLFINGKHCNEKIEYKVTKNDEITYKSDKTESARNVTVSISENKMEGYLHIEYMPECTYKLKDKPIHRNLALKTIKVAGKYPKKYTVTEIKEILRQNKITDGILYKNLIEACALGTNEKILIARGIPAIDDTPNEVKILFDLGEKKIINENTSGNIDYRNIYSISNIEEGQVLAEIIPGKAGQDGKNICSEILKKKSIKIRHIKAGEGCKIEGNKIIATKTGRPSSKNGVLSVNSIYKIQDVDIRSGNIFFAGDVNISGNVKEGMTVKSGNSMFINKNVDSATIIAGGEINIRGSVIKSTIFTGQVDIEKKMYLEKLNEYKNNIIKLTNAVNKLNEASNNSRKISELVKILIENRYKEIPKLSLSIITHNICYDSDKNQLVDFIRNKMMGLNLSKINSLNNLKNLEELIENEIDFLEDDMIIPSDIYIGYCQDSSLKSTGDIVITGKGQYVSKLTALKDIIFLRNDSVARGGTLSARGNMKLGIVGSPSGVTTKLEVLKDGIITANIAHNNTIFCFGKKCKTLDVSGRNIRAYMNKEEEIIIDKFIL